MLYLIVPVLAKQGNVDDPTQESWGGQFRQYDAALYPSCYVDFNEAPEVCQ